MSNNYLYLLKQMKKGRFKIGITKGDVPFSELNRVRQLSKIWGDFDFDSVLAHVDGNPMIVEKFLHQEFASNRIDCLDKLDGYTEFFNEECFESALARVKKMISVKSISRLRENDLSMRLEGDYIKHASVSGQVNINGQNFINLIPKNYNSFCVIEDMSLGGPPKKFINLSGDAVYIKTIKLPNRLMVGASFEGSNFFLNEKVILNTEAS